VSQNSVSRCLSTRFNLQIKSLPFNEVPGQSRLFLDYLEKPLELKKYYPAVVESHAEIADRIPEILANYKTDRGKLCEILDHINRACGAGDKTFENIELLRDSECVAVLTGQQSGLFTGPLYTIYKALSAVKTAEFLCARGYKAVPVFWSASEDHDFEEVSKAFVIGKQGDLKELKYISHESPENLPVGYIELEERINQTVDELFNNLELTEFSEESRKIIEECWHSGEFFGNAFLKLLSRIFSKYGLIFFDPLDKRLKQLAKPLIVEAIEKSDEIVSALRKRSDELVADGYHAQVLIGEDYFPLFWQADDKTRNALKKNRRGNFQTKDNTQEFNINELAEIAAREPERFSPSVVLRPVVQDYLLPTICYFGGGAEIAYFAQNSEVYRLLNRPAAKILHRQSFTVVETRHRRTMKRYDLSFKDLFGEKDVVLSKIVEEFLNKETARLFAEAEEKINIELNRLDQNLSQIEATLSENLAKRRRKILYHIGAMRHKFHLSQVRRDETVRRRIESMFTALTPHHQLQERTLNISYFLNRYGTNFIDWLYEAVDLEDKAHRIIYL